MHDTLTNKTQPALLDATGLLVAVSRQPCGQCVVPNAGSQEGCALAFRCRVFFFLVSMAELFSVVNSMLSCCRTSANPMLDMLGICVNSTYLSGHHIGVPVWLGLGGWHQEKWQVHVLLEALQRVMGRSPHKLASLLDGLSAFVHWTTKVERPSNYIHMAEVVIVPGTAQSLPQVVLKASEDLKAFEREVAALVSLRPVGQATQATFWGPCIGNCRGQSTKAWSWPVSCLQFSCWGPVGNCWRSPVIQTVIFSVRGRAWGEEDQAGSSQSWPIRWPVLDGQSDGKFDGCSIEDSVDLGEDNSFHFVLVDGHIHGQSTHIQAQNPSNDLLSGHVSLQSFLIQPVLDPDMLPWNPVGRTKVFLQEKETRQQAALCGRAV